MSKLIQNAVNVGGVFIKSAYTHDYQQFIVNGETYALDGGTEYCKRSGDFNQEPEIDTSYTLWSDDDFEYRADRFLWGTRGKSGREPLKYVRIKDMELDHINACLCIFVQPGTNLDDMPDIPECAFTYMVYWKQVKERELAESSKLTPTATTPRVLYKVVKLP